MSDQKWHKKDAVVGSGEPKTEIPEPLVAMAVSSLRNSVQLAGRDWKNEVHQMVLWPKITERRSRRFLVALAPISDG